MTYDIPPPKTLPEPGYYYHFKHDPAGPLNNYAYYIYTASDITQRIIVRRQTPSCRYIGRSMGSPHDLFKIVR